MGAQTLEQVEKTKLLVFSETSVSACHADRPFSCNREDEARIEAKLYVYLVFSEWG